MKTNEHPESYNGWANYATWRVNLEIVDDYANSLLQDVENESWQRAESVSTLAEQFKEYVEEAICEDGQRTQLACDYAMAFISDVDWYEIAEHWTDELVEAEDVDAS